MAAILSRRQSFQTMKKKQKKNGMNYVTQLFLLSSETIYFVITILHIYQTMANHQSYKKTWTICDGTWSLYMMTLKSSFTQ